MKRIILSILLAFTLIGFIFSSPAVAASAPARKTNNSSRITVLAYHHIIPGPLPKDTKSLATITASEFEAQMEFLYKNGYYTASLKELEDFLYKKKDLPHKTVLITFDDGYESNYIYAFPVLKKYGLRATIFLIGSRIAEDEKEFNSQEKLAKLSWHQIKEMAESGLIEFGSHTFDAHHYLNGKPVTISTSSNDLEKDFEKLENLFRDKGLPRPFAFAYPYGRYNDDLIRAAKKFYTLGFTINKGYVYHNSNPFELSRIIVPPHTGIEEFKKLLGHQDFDKSTAIFMNIGSTRAYVDGKPVSLPAPPFIKSGRVMVPLRFISEALGLNVQWNYSRREIVIFRGETSVKLVLNSSKTELSQGVPIDLGVPPLIKGERVFVPVRLFSELGFKIKWNEKMKSIELWS
ncbi:Poly-beta-1,6-N-acetyl-D-glucosamine N-deacetylase [Fervidicola ferrireducens]|uniref:Poly-beta-1,6-N-acetyl-D-glucosamine N-deacetylase n=2 Tax=Fervidicola ferrireducens TaxID=520764 RepID=A0A140L864_9FIRM|nr:Poly-beta-1,6-N-acetyl-D-glucosamine N-deacetylase [Fervidicola ferrireducens]